LRFVGLEAATARVSPRMVAVRKRGARQKSLLLWMRRRYEVVQPSEPRIHFIRKSYYFEWFFYFLPQLSAV